LLHDDFYTTHDIQESENEFGCRLVFNEGHAIFKGHFPGNPVVPGVCMMEIVKELLQLQISKTLMLRKAGNVKFLQLITPDVQPGIKISWKEHEAGYTVKANFTSGTATLFKLDGDYIINT
jgi:3-hydroxyacyl-[acyl-carrier-protein] dehydratase